MSDFTRHPGFGISPEKRNTFGPMEKVIAVECGTYVLPPHSLAVVLARAPAEPG